MTKKNENKNKPQIIKIKKICVNLYNLWTNKQGGIEMKKIVLFLIIILFVFTVMQSKRITVLKEVSKPNLMVAGNDRLYITEGATIYIYSSKDFQLLKKFGKRGEGPGEFNIPDIGAPLIVFPFDGKLMVNSNARVSFFSKDGEFIEEFKVLPFLVYQPFGNSYIGTGNAVDEKGQMVLSLNLYNAKFERVKELYKTDMVMGASVSFNFPITTFDFPVYKDRIYIAAGKEGFVIEVFDNKGNKLYRIKKDYQQLPVPEEYKKKTMEWCKIYFKQYWDMFRNRISFKEYYPAVQRMVVTDDRIYILTFKKQNEDTECIIFDLEGNEQKRVYLPLPQTYGTEIPIFDIHNQGFYYLVENEDEEVWELHRKDVK
jgi:hypothetical protein